MQAADNTQEMMLLLLLLLLLLCRDNGRAAFTCTHAARIHTLSNTHSRASMNAHTTPVLASS